MRIEIMKTIESFLTFFYILDRIYNHCKENDLGGFLGQISPELWGDGKSIDNSVFTDWIMKSNPEVCNEENIVNEIYNFLEYYEKKYRYDFSRTKKYLVESFDKNIIQDVNKKVMRMYQKFNYND